MRFLVEVGLATGRRLLGSGSRRVVVPKAVPFPVALLPLAFMLACGYQPGHPASLIQLEGDVIGINSKFLGVRRLERHFFLIPATAERNQRCVSGLSGALGPYARWLRSRKYSG